MTDKKLLAGIDFGGTKTEIVVLDGTNGKELYTKRIPTARDNYQITVDNMVGLVKEAEKSLNSEVAVGLGMTGCIDNRTKLAKNANTTWVNGKPLLEDLSVALNRTVRIANDANCFAVSEAVDGAGAGKHVVFGVIIGTGCGGGLVIDGKPIVGVNDITGQWGHIPLPYPKTTGWKDSSKFFTESLYTEGRDIVYNENDKKWLETPGEMCYCGKRGCLETWISGTGFKMDYQRVEKEDLSTHDIIANAKKREPKAVFALERYADRLARSLSVVINVIDPEIIVLGGGMSNIEELYEMVPARWGQYIDSDTIHTELVPPRYGDSSGVRGAAWLWND